MAVMNCALSCVISPEQPGRYPEPKIELLRPPTLRVSFVVPRTGLSILLAGNQLAI